MIKFFPLVLGLLFPLAGAFAQDMDKSNEDIIQACSKAKDGIEGTFITYKEGTCEYSGCAYVYGATDIKYDGTNQRAKGCGDQSLSSLQKKAKDAKKAEIDAQIAELEKKKKKVSAIGGDGTDGDGKTKVELTDLNGDGVVDDKDRAIYERMLKDAKDGDGYDENGRKVTSSNGTVRIEECNFDLTVDHACYKKCMRKDGFLGIFGKRTILKLDRRACLKCLAGYGIYPVDNNGKVIGGASVKIKCTTGMVVGADGRCGHNHGSGNGSGNGNGGGNGNGNGNGNGGGNGNVTVNGSIEVPSYCHSTKASDKQACEAWIRANARFACSSSSDTQRCMGGDYNEVMSRYQYDGCVNCQSSRRGGSGTLSGIAEIVGAIAPVGVAALGAHAQIRSAQAWAGAAEVGFQQCAVSQNNYLTYLSTNELPGMTPEQQAQQNCNGYSLGGFAGMGGGQYGSYLGAGYTPGYMGGMMGQYGGYNPYGGGYAGGAVGGVYTGGIAGGMYAGGMVGGMYAGGYNGGMYAGGMQGGLAGGGGLVNGISLAGGVAAGTYAAGYAGGAYAAGYAGGGVYAGGYNGGMYNGGGYNGGMYAGGIGIAGGMQGGMYAGGMQGGMYAGGMQGGMYEGGMQGGMYAGGMQGGMYAGGMQGGMYAGGYAGGINQGGNGYYGQNQNYYQQDYSASMGASNYDRMLQQQGTAYQMGQTASGYGSAGYYPSNMGASIYGSFGVGGY